MNCAECIKKVCKKEMADTLSCCTNLAADMAKIKDEYRGTYAKISKAALDAVGDGKQSRLDELVAFLNLMDYKKIGLALCAAMHDEAATVSSRLKKEGFIIYSIMCKIGAISRKDVGLPDSSISLCNPLAQAEFLNQSKTDINIVLGLCIGHDIMFSKASHAPHTTLAVKDRKHGNNPCLGLTD